MNCSLFGLVVVGLMMLVSSQRNTYHYVHIFKEGVEIAQDIIHDIDENTVTVAIGDPSMKKGLEATVNYHDFNTGYVVFKNIRRQLCLLSRAPIPFATPETYAEGRSNVTMTYLTKINPILMSHGDVIKIAGEKIANFCRDYRTYARTLTPKGRNVRDIAEKEEPCDNFCYHCALIGSATELETLG